MQQQQLSRSSERLFTTKRPCRCPALDRHMQKQELQQNVKSRERLLGK